jgi:hypothetical protein
MKYNNETCYIAIEKDADGEHVEVEKFTTTDGKIFYRLAMIPEYAFMLGHRLLRLFEEVQEKRNEEN